MLAVKDPAEERPKPGIGSSTPCKEDIMKKLIVLPAVLLLLACQDHNPVQPEPEVAPELALVQARGGPGNVAKMVPWQGSGTWRVVGDALGCEGRLDWYSLFLEVEGTAAHTGRLRGAETICFSLDGVWQSNSLIFTAANGDLLYLRGSKEDYGSIHTFHEAGFSLTGVRFLGGTGRFANAEGWYDLWVTTTSYFPLPAGTWELEGELSTVGSTRGGR
jgi:hypothetical protein